MNDHELLRMAAKAAGITGADDGAYSDLGILIPSHLNTPQHRHYEVWSPLTDDGDALRLAVAMRLDIKFLDGFKQVCCRRSDDRDNFEMHGLVGYGEGADPWVSAENVRRAIVRAAAAIGEAMQ